MIRQLFEWVEGVGVIWDKGETNGLLTSSGCTGFGIQGLRIQIGRGGGRMPCRP